MDERDQPEPVTDEEVLAYMQRQLRSGRVKPAVLMDLTQKAYAEVSRERIVHCSTSWNRRCSAVNTSKPRGSTQVWSAQQADPLFGRQESAEAV